MSSSCFIRTGRKEFDDLIPLVESFLRKDVLEMSIDGNSVTGFRSPDAKSLWIRDHSDMLRVGRYFLDDVTSAVEHFADTQSATGRIFDYFSTSPEKLPSERENWTKYVRVPVEADVEYRFVKAAFLAWQANADDEWIRRMLPRMDKALEYVISHPWYWESELGMVKRAYTIDTWDFAYTAGRHDWLQFQIDDNTFWGIMHGDNSGYYEAYRVLAFFHDRFGDTDRSAIWDQRAAAIRKRLSETCWNGSYYTHFVKLGDFEIPGVDEPAQLSLSNPMAINRGAATHEQAIRILREYLTRGQKSGAFAEWFSIDPPFPDGVFGDERLVGGAYVNGGIMPLVGGELAKAAFDHGVEEYGVDILMRYYEMISKSCETYLWYFPDGSPATVESSTSPDAEPTDGWGSSAMAWALISGLAGVEDLGSGFDTVRLSPRWPAAGVCDAEVLLSYECSRRSVGYEYRCDSDRIKLNVSAERCRAQFHVLLPEGVVNASVVVNGSGVSADIVSLEMSTYADFSHDVDGGATVAIDFQRAR